jgi:hypothetical protein
VEEKSFAFAGDRTGRPECSQTLYRHALNPTHLGLGQEYLKNILYFFSQTKQTCSKYIYVLKIYVEIVTI